jgi:mannose-6-phosphate isomerase-like protein (cupin superfamily)
MIEEVCYKNTQMALIIWKEYRSDGIQFLTPNTYSQQLGYMNRPKGYVISPHVHTLAPREVHFTNEVLFIRSGKLRIDFYTSDHCYCASKILRAGDTILLIGGGHGFEMLEDCEIIEVKQGPYVGDNDKIRFSPVAPELLKIEKLDGTKEV